MRYTLDGEASEDLVDDRARQMVQEQLDHIRSRQPERRASEQAERQERIRAARALLDALQDGAVLDAEG